MLETEVFQLVLNPSNSKAIRQWRVDLESFLGDLLPLSTAEKFQSAHVVKPVGELDEDDTDIIRHRQDHLAEIFRLFFFIAPERDFANFGHPIDQMHDILSELPFELV